MIDWIGKSWDIVWKCAMTNSRWWSLVGYSKHEAQQWQTLGHKALPAPAEQVKMMTAVDVMEWLQRQAEWLLVGSVALKRADSCRRERTTCVIRSGTRNQCKSFSSSVTCSYLRVPVVRWAAALMTDCSRSRSCFGRPESCKDKSSMYIRQVCMVCTHEECVQCVHVQITCDMM